MLSIPPAFVLSQDQTLNKSLSFAFRLLDLVHSMIFWSVHRTCVFYPLLISISWNFRFYGTILFSMTLFFFRQSSDCCVARFLLFGHIHRYAPSRVQTCALHSADSLQKNLSLCSTFSSELLYYTASFLFCQALFKIYFLNFLKRWTESPAALCSPRQLN